MQTRPLCMRKQQANPSGNEIFVKLLQKQISTKDKVTPKACPTDDEDQQVGAWKRKETLIRKVDKA